MDGLKNLRVAVFNLDKESYFLGLYNNKEDAALRRLDIKYNLFGFEFMTDIEKTQYNKLLTSREIKKDGDNDAL